MCTVLWGYSKSRLRLWLNPVPVLARHPRRNDSKQQGQGPWSRSLSHLWSAPAVKSFWIQAGIHRANVLSPVSLTELNAPSRPAYSGYRVMAHSRMMIPPDPYPVESSGSAAKSCILCTAAAREKLLRNGRCIPRGQCSMTSQEHRGRRGSRAAKAPERPNVKPRSPGEWLPPGAVVCSVYLPSG